MNRELTKEDLSTMQRESFGELLGQLVSHSASLVGDEIKLAKQEMLEELQSFRSGAITLVIGAALVWIALLTLCAAVVIGLSVFMGPGMAALVTGVGLVVVGGTIAFIGFRQLMKTMLKPEKTIRSM
jgi:Putative Actinobacterial Holin-X, holin superfamily III